MNVARSARWVAIRVDGRVRAARVIRRGGTLLIVYVGAQGYMLDQADVLGWCE